MLIGFLATWLLWDRSRCRCSRLCQHFQTQALFEVIPTGMSCLAIGHPRAERHELCAFGCRGKRVQRATPQRSL
jgi:hypothetical protein